ncbi:radical SAM protein [Nocardia yunnanensis]|uniref:Radical SAM protein n=1 Tax=Nocardia yunnanensis TaxID=2382165 RepID=A0A386ZPL4_9NOCA|nr:radical SAM protein [Nocardia yunnanensis]
MHRFQRPEVLLAALYHPENFPLPRFPLAISDLARATRATLCGRVRLMDMQLGVTLEELLASIAAGVDVLGISATFGQHDLLATVLDTVADMEDRPVTIAGGSLVARTEKLLLADYPWLLIARGAGEPTIADTVAHWHDDIDQAQIRGIGFAGAAFGEGTLTVGRYRHTANVANRALTDFLPELDLLAPTLARGGVAQLEASRGCTNTCSFCPRGHKGSHTGCAPVDLDWMVGAISGIFDHFPDRSRTLYLVDEEFIGAGPDAAHRALELAATVAGHGMAWESSCRIDQVVDPAQDRAWHIERAAMWRQLCRDGCRRCLFGVESGVTSILDRFHKETTGEQNALAIRTLSALGVPPRYTYITFDPLMSCTELEETTAFQARTDLLLKPCPELTPAQIVDGVRDESFVAEHETGRPFYSEISYLLVSMECLIGAAYTRAAHAAGLTGDANPMMGRLDSRFADWRIGVFSGHAQRWIDRNFALDYALKSIEKLIDGQARLVVRAARRVLKNAAFDLLTAMVGMLEVYPLEQPELHAALDGELNVLRDGLFAKLRDQLAGVVEHVCQTLPAADGVFLRDQHRQWSQRTGWDLINAADPCGT